MSKRPYANDPTAMANANALANRGRTYASENAASWQVRFGGRPNNMTTRALVAELTKALAEQVPVKLHEGPDHIDAGGTPAMTGAFMAYLDGRPMDVDVRRDDPAYVEGTYRKPLHAALDGMKHDLGKHAWWGRIAERIILGSEHPTKAAIAEGSHPYEAVRTANEALSCLYSRLSTHAVALPRSEVAA